MAKKLLVLALVATQLITWASGSLYMCVANDGSVAVDGGPSSCRQCDCREREPCAAGGHTHASPHRSSCHQCEHAGAPSSELCQTFCDRPCDCRHVLISQSQASSALRQSGVDVEWLAQACVAALPTPGMSELMSTIERSLRLEPSHELSPRLRALSSVLLRC